MDTRTFRLFDLYTDFLLASFGLVTATGLSDLVPEVSHDQITRLLSGSEFGDKDLWRIVKPHVRRVQSEDAVLILDDTIEEKPYTDASELICWHFDHVTNRTVKGVNLLSALYLSQNVSLPVAFHLVQKTELVTDPETGKDKWQSPVTKNEIARQIIASVLQKQIPLQYVLADSWFSSADNMVFIKQKAKKDFIIPLKSNRNVFVADAAAKAGKPTKLSAIDFGTDKIRTLYLEGVPFALQIMRQAFTNQDGSEGILYLSTSDLSLSASSLQEIYQKRWKIEEYHKSLKSNASFARSPTKRVRTQSNHFFASIAAFVKLEACRIAAGTNHFALKSRIYKAAMQSALAKLQQIKTDCPKAATTA